MRNINQQKPEQTTERENPDYLRGYRDGMKDRRVIPRSTSADGLLGALLAVTLIAGIGYFGYNYATTGQFFPTGVELHNPFPNN